MHRRQFIGSARAASGALCGHGRAGAAESGPLAPLPKRERVKVADREGGDQQSA